MITDDCFHSIVERDFFFTFCGDLIGQGAFREVYEYALDPTYVVKIETAARSFSNIQEWLIWNEVKWTPEVAKWLAPCKLISPSGSILVQKRTRPAKNFPEKMPSWMTDFKRTNFGMLGSQFVAHDYGGSLALSRGVTTRMKKVEWWDLSSPV